VPLGSLSGRSCAAADLNGDGRAEIIVSPPAAQTTRGKVAVYTYDPAQKKMIATGVEFIAYTYPYGANIAVADIDGTGKPVIVTAPGFGQQNPALVSSGSWTPRRWSAAGQPRC